MHIPNSVSTSQIVGTFHEFLDSSSPKCKSSRTIVQLYPIFQKLGRMSLQANGNLKIWKTMFRFVKSQFMHAISTVIGFPKMERYTAVY